LVVKAEYVIEIKSLTFSLSKGEVDIYQHARECNKEKRIIIRQFLGILVFVKDT
jgi:hypothetical protein